MASIVAGHSARGSRILALASSHLIMLEIDRNPGPQLRGTFLFFNILPAVLTLPSMTLSRMLIDRHREEYFEGWIGEVQESAGREFKRFEYIAWPASNELDL